MKDSYIVIGLFALTLLASGCLGSVQPKPEPDQDIPENNEGAEDEPVDNGNISSETEVDRTISITGYSNISYDTEEVSVARGETIEFVYINEGGVHNLVLEENGEDVTRTETLSSNGETDSFTYTFEEEGEYEFYCSVGSHRAQGMEGKINLQTN
jgi:plastocyanin